MNTAVWAPLVLRSRIGLLPSPPRGTTSRILKNRLDKTSRRSFANHVSDSEAAWATLVEAGERHGNKAVKGRRSSANRVSDSEAAWAALIQAEERHGNKNVKGGRSSADRGANNEASWPALDHAASSTYAPGSTGEEIMILRNMLLALRKPQTPQPQAGHPSVSATEETEMSESREHAMRLTTSDQRADFVLQTLRAKDTNSLFHWLTNPVVATGPEGRQTYVDEAQISEERQNRAAAIARLPPVVFAEALRMLDPYVVSKNIDALADIAVSPSMAQLTPLGAGVSVFGIRVLYTRLLDTLLSICELRVQLLGDQGHLLLNDFIVLLRAAGAASDMVQAKSVWKAMVPSGFMDMRHGQLYAEFLRARFLTERLYVQHDPMRMRVQAVNRHRHKKVMHASRLYHLERMRIRAERGMMHRFGHNINAPDHAEHLTRILRSRKPLTKVYYKAILRHHGNDERVQAAAMVGFGRSASMRIIQDLLATKYGVSVKRIRGTNGYRVRGRTNIPTTSTLYPSEVLLDAVVQAYCCNNRVALAMQLVMHISRVYKIKIPDRVWFDLLNWAYALASPQVTQESRIAGISQRNSPAAIKRIWKTMTSEPYSVKPGLEQYNILIKTMLAHDSSILPALQLMRQLKPVYQAQLRKQEEAMQVVAETRMLGHRDRGAAAFRLQRVIAGKWRMWYYFHSWCLRILKNGARAKPGDELLARLIPQVIDEFRPFVHRYTWYPTPTGTVTLREPHNHSKLLSEKIAYKIPASRPSARFQYRDVSQLDEDEPAGRPPPVNHFDTEFFSGSALTTGGAATNTNTSTTNTTTADDGSALQESYSGAPGNEMETYKVRVDLDTIAHDSVVDKLGNALTPEQLRWYDRRFVRDADLRRVVMRQRAFPNSLVDLQGSLGRDRDSLVREFS
ncbi:hypothetical protein HMPREF1624_05288 [Sporothrix schenckii ATCC 58251]|uniref:Uncharacterized protein n=1 Tax=Sporothrix schenckii (strain ATCC 58251 / de Perez 2211183) TaxID=1391915 RepID=U7PUU2_SPOS1|nr:hypothetical protein HMPREF1624_05288 [Sporothrix schenckii ATCC 58251]